MYVFGLFLVPVSNDSGKNNKMNCIIKCKKWVDNPVKTYLKNIS